MNVAMFLRFVRQIGISTESPLHLWSRFTSRSIDTIDVKATWVSPGGDIVVLSPATSMDISNTNRSVVTDRGISIEHFESILQCWLRQAIVTGETPLGVYDGISGSEVMVAIAKDAVVPLGNKCLVVTQFSRDELCRSYGGGKSDSN